MTRARYAVRWSCSLCAHSVVIEYQSHTDALQDSSDAKACPTHGQDTRVGGTYNITGEPIEPRRADEAAPNARKR